LKLRLVKILNHPESRMLLSSRTFSCSPKLSGRKEGRKKGRKGGREEGMKKGEKGS
jgi:hypothetical protein